MSHGLPSKLFILIRAVLLLVAFPTSGFSQTCTVSMPAILFGNIDVLPGAVGRPDDGGEVDDRLRSQSTVEVIVQEDLRRAADFVASGQGGGPTSGRGRTGRRPFA